MPRFGWLIVLMMSFSIAFAQEESYSERVREKGKTVLMAGIETSTTAYIDTETKDSSAITPYLAVGLNYHHSSGFGTRIKTYSYIKNANSDLYLSALSLYYANYNGTVIPFISYTRYWQHNTTAIPYSPVQNEIFAMARLSSFILEPSAGIDIGFGKDKLDNDKTVSDVSAFAGISHMFLWNPNQKDIFIALVPSIQLNAGTNRYYNYTRVSRYISRNRSSNQMNYGGGRNNGNRQGNGNVADGTLLINESNGFGLSNLEANLYAGFTYGRFQVEPGGSLYFPLEKGDNNIYGYWQININFFIR